MPNYNNLKALFTGIADAIRSKTGSTDPIVADNFPAEIEAIQTGGGKVVCLSDDPWDDITLAECEGVNISFPNAQAVADSAFRDCTALASVDLPVALTIGSGVFRGCTSLTSINLPMVQSVGSTAFYDCTALTSIDLPMVERVGNTAFRDCTALASVNLPKVKNVGNTTFRGCTSLTSVDLPMATNIGTSFWDCTALTTLIIRTPTMCVIDIGAFDDSGFLYNEDTGKNNGHIYVPSALYEDYRDYHEEDVNFEAGEGSFDIIFRKIEDYPEICG